MTLSRLPLLQPTSVYKSTTRCDLNPPTCTHEYPYRYNSRGNHRVPIASTLKGNLDRFGTYRVKSCE